MRLLLDTHSFLWFAGGDERLSLDARSAIADVTVHCDDLEVAYAGAQGAT
jgi:PIN domain nuclease of toxin-antitoxin system